VRFISVIIKIILIDRPLIRHKVIDCVQESERRVCGIVNTAMEPDTAADFTVENVEKVK